MKLAMRLFAAVVGMPLVLGCGSSGGDGVGGKDPNVVSTYELKNLLPAEYETPDLDGKRVRIPTPKGWKIGDRQGNILIRFYADHPAGLPRIVVTAEPSKYEGITAITEDNLLDFSDQLQAELEGKQQETGKAHFRQPCKPVFLGNNAWVRYVAGGKWKEHSVERVFLKTIYDKRLYTIEMNVMTGKIPDFQKALYAVAGRTVFGPKDDAPAAEPSVPAEPAATEK